MTLVKWVLLDEDGEPIRFFSYQAEGTVQWPPAVQSLDRDDPEWYNIPF